MVIGATAHPNQGSAYIFVKEEDNWIMQQKLVGENGGGADGFGQSVSINGNFVIVGAPGQGSKYNFEHNQENYCSGAGEIKFPCDMNSGAVYIFERENNEYWKQYATIVNPFLVIGNYSDDRFGWSVGIDNHLNVAIGIPGNDNGTIYVCNVINNVNSTTYNHKAAKFIHNNNACNLDKDNDNLTNTQEIYNYETNPFLADTDGDGLNDGEEIQYHTDPKLNDTDQDGLNDSYEVDNITLSSEYVYFSNGTSTSLTNISVLVRDSDRDGILDGVEVLILKSNPLSSDSDGDGLSDGEEFYIYSTSLIHKDSDLDGISDLLEIRKFKTSPSENNNPQLFYNNSNYLDYNWYLLLAWYFISDEDGDRVPDHTDNCPSDYNPTQYDKDGDGIGYECEERIYQEGDNSNKGYYSALECGIDGNTVTYIGDAMINPNTGQWAEVYVCDGKNYYLYYYK